MIKRYEQSQIDELAKICALLDRTTARDLFDVYTLSKYDLFDTEEKVLLRQFIDDNTKLFYDKFQKEIYEPELLYEYKFKFKLFLVMFG